MHIEHNILLDDGTQTNPGLDVLSDTQSCKALIRTLTIHFPEACRSSVRVADLGCLEGGYAVEFARHGFDVTGIEAREENLKKCEYVASRVSLPNLRFIKDDVKNLANWGHFDVIFCGGLLYHLDKPVEFIKLLGTVTTRMLLLNTHYSQDHDAVYDGWKPVWLRRILASKFGPPARHDYKLSRLTTNENIKGRWYKEYRVTASQDDIEQNRLASYSNYRSFWPTKKYLIQSLRDSGFSIIYEQFDILENMFVDNYIENDDRTLFVCIKQ